MATVYHALIRDAVYDSLVALELSAQIHKLDDPEDVKLLSLPAVAVAPVGPEQDRPDWSTNASDGTGYPIIVMLLSSGVTGGTSTPGPPSILEFRRVIHTTFHNKRLSGVTQVGYCEVQDAGAIFDEKSPAFQRLQTALVVTAVGRFPRS